MAAKVNSEPSSSSSSDDGSIKEEVDNQPIEDTADKHHGSDEEKGDCHHSTKEGTGTEGTDESKVFLSRIPQTFTNESIKRVLEESFGEDCVIDVSLVYEKSEDSDDWKNKGKDDHKDKQSAASTNPKSKDDTQQQHRGFAFVTFSSHATRQQAIDAGTVRGSAKPSSKRRHTLYIQPVVREEEGAGDDKDANKNICFLWKNFRCPYGDDCKFAHEGEGGCAANKASDGKDGESKNAVQKCFSFKKKGKCKLGDKCPFSHDVIKKSDDAEKKDATDEKNNNKRDEAQKDCINWKNKGKCRKGDKCPFRHDELVKQKVLTKKGKNNNVSNNNKQGDKAKQSLSVRVFGLNYDTTKEDIEIFFKDCGKIMEITFPTFDDSDRSKGYCGVLFTSPKAVAKAVEMNGSELHGRWLSIQEGKMFLRKWEEVENERRGGKGGGADKRSFGEDGGREKKELMVGEFGQKVKKRKKHGYAE